MKCKKCGFEGFARKKYLSSKNDVVLYCPRCSSEVKYDRPERIKGYCKTCDRFRDDELGQYCWLSSELTIPDGYCWQYEEKKNEQL